MCGRPPKQESKDNACIVRDTEPSGKNGGDVVLLEIQPKVYEVFQLLGFSQFFNIRNNQEEATSFFTNGEGILPDVFPAIVSCPVCRKKLKATKAGRFRCSGCKSIIAIDSDAEISLG
mgnify:CR=1 FL=1